MTVAKTKTCTGTTKNGSPCSKRAVKDGRCRQHPRAAAPPELKVLEVNVQPIYFFEDDEGVQKIPGPAAAVSVKGLKRFADRDLEEARRAMQAQIAQMMPSEGDDG